MARNAQEKKRLESFRLMMIRQNGLIEELGQIKDNDSERSDKIRTELSELLTKMNLIRKDIELLEEPYKTILYNHYILGHSFRRISADLHYEHKYLYRLHTDALGIIKKIRDRS